MTLYEINKQMEELLSMIINPHTGEITEPDALSDIQMKREDKLEAIALIIKNNAAEAGLNRAEENGLAKRKHKDEKTDERLKNLL